MSVKKWNIRSGWKKKSHRRASERMEKYLKGTRDAGLQRIQEIANKEGLINNVTCS